MNQVQLVPWLKDTFDIDLIEDAVYRNRWCKANLEIFLYGMVV